MRGYPQRLATGVSGNRQSAAASWRDAIPSDRLPLELPDQALALADALAQGRVLRLEPGERGGRRLGARLPPTGDPKGDA